MTDRSVIGQRIVELEQLAQRAGEERLELAHVSLEDIPEDLEHEIGDTLAGPYCGCLTCEVREVLHAAYPHLKEIALLEHAMEQAEQAAIIGKPS